MTKEQLKKLKLEDFQAPNQVLCYGAGIMGRSLMETYQSAGLHVVGFIDKNKQGTVNTAFGALPIYSISSAVQSYGKEIVVIITIGHSRIFPEIISDLTAAGVSRERIYDWNFFNWLTVPSPKCYCRELFHNVILSNDSLMQCCYWGNHRNFNVEMLEGSVPFEVHLQNYAEKIRYYSEQALKGEVPLSCAGCPHLEEEFPENDAPQFDLVVFGASAQCNAACIYCNAMTETDHSKLASDAAGYGEMFSALLDYFARNHLMAPQALVTFAAGEISISPRRKELLEFALNHPSYRYQFLSNCAVYSEEIAQVLAQNPENRLMCDLDAGTAETYTLIKGYNYFESAVDHLKRYAEHGHVILKYIVMPGFNATREDYEGSLRVLKKLGLKEMALSREFYHLTNPFEERKTLFEVARFKKILTEHGISSILCDDAFDERQKRIIEHLYRQLSK